MGNKRNRNKASRDAKLIKQSWNEVDAIYTAIAESIVTVAGSANEGIRLLRTEGYEHNQELIVAVRGLNQDLEQFTNDLLTIKSRHDGLRGEIDSEEEFALSCSVFTDYHTLSDRFRGIIFSPMLTITEYLTEAAYAATPATEDTTNDQ